MSIVANIQKLCLSKNISIKKLEVELGFGNGTTYKWDSNMPAVSKVVKVAQYFGVTVDFLLADNGPAVTPDDLERLEREIELQEQQRKKTMAKIVELKRQLKQLQKRMLRQKGA